jgi:hypothetical protein
MVYRVRIVSMLVRGYLRTGRRQVRGKIDFVGPEYLKIDQWKVE